MPAFQWVTWTPSRWEAGLRFATGRHEPLATPAAAEFTATAEIETPADLRTAATVGVLPYGLRRLLRADEPTRRRWCKMPNVAINGLGRTGRAALKIGSFRRIM
jgi:hypothetical protein